MSTTRLSASNALACDLRLFTNAVRIRFELKYIYSIRLIDCLWIFACQRIPVLWARPQAIGLRPEVRILFYSEVPALAHSKPWPFQTPGLQAHQARVAPHTQAFELSKLGSNQSVSRAVCKEFGLHMTRETHQRQLTSGLCPARSRRVGSATRWIQIDLYGNMPYN